MPRTGPREMYRQIPVKEKFDRHWLGEPNSGCWLWDGAGSPNGYGQFSVGYGKTAQKIGAHRASYIIHCGTIPDGMQVCHKCDVKCCVNPTHLFVGTAKDNMQDASRKGKMRGAENVARGELNSKAKLTTEKVLAIRASSERAAVLAERYGVTEMSIWCARTRRSWKHVT